MRPSLGLLLRPLRRVVRALRTTRRTIAAVPDVVDAILVLPSIARRLETISFATATLPEMHAEIARVRGDTKELARIDDTLLRVRALLEQVEVNTVAVQQLADVAVPLHGAALRVGRFADRLPQRRVGDR
jgi:hypothetical protein